MHDKDRGLEMKRALLLVTGALMFGLLAAALLAGCGGDRAATTTAPSDPAATTATAPTTTLSAGDTGVDYPAIVYNTVEGLGKGNVDIEAWKATESAQKLIEYSRNGFLYKNEMDPAVLAYWEGLGIKKELHDADDPLLKWSSLTPVAALEPGNTHTYPVVFCFHGNAMNIFSSEGYGFGEVGAREGFITICPEANNSDGVTAAAEIVRILDVLEQGGYPIDRSRVYCVGMSKGGGASALAALALPDVVTAICVHGSSWAFNTDENGVGSVPMFVPESAFAAAMDTDIPMAAIIGEFDFDQLPLRSEGCINGLDLWLQVNDCPTRLTLEDSLAAQASSTDPAVKFVGVVGDWTSSETIMGEPCHIVGFDREDGVTMVEIVGVENLPHWTTGFYPDFAWEFLSKFSKDADGDLIVAE
jgi:pimeloyl-ACP methyl ester carboxylesterase